MEPSPPSSVPDCASFRIRRSAFDSNKGRPGPWDFSDSLAEYLGERLRESLGMSVNKGRFYGCAGRLIGEKKVATALCVSADSIPGGDEYLGGFFCDESPSRKFIFFRRARNGETARNRQAVLAALHTILESDLLFSEVRWMDEAAWASQKPPES
jgi:hypothetical protein